MGSAGQRSAPGGEQPGVLAGSRELAGDLVGIDFTLTFEDGLQLLIDGDRGAGATPAQCVAVIPSRHLAEFLITVYVLILIPGPSVLFVISRGVSLGRRAAFISAVGNETGLTLQLALVSVGLGAIVARSDAVFTVLKLVGAAYLAFLGVRNIRDRKRLAEIFGAGSSTPKPLGRIYREGAIVGATNPKGILIFTAVLPEFIDRSQGHVTLQIASLGLICVLIALLSDGLWALLSGTARQWLGSSPRRLERMSATGGVMLVGLGVGLAVTGRKN